jgi:tripeptide aminopeptidase
MNGTVESAVMDYIIRDHDRQKFEARKAFFASCCDFLNKKYGEDTAVPEINDTYYNLKDALTDHMDLIDRACEAMRSIGVEPVITPVRGGTDGCHLSYAGLPCPNLFTGGHNYHGKYEYIVRESMEKSVELLLALARK